MQMLIIGKDKYMENENKFKSFLASTWGKIATILFFVVLIWGIILWMTEIEFEAGILIVAAICAIFGWRALNRITPNIFLFMSWTGWLFYFAIKGVLAILIGLFIAPFQISKMIADAISNECKK